MKKLITILSIIFCFHFSIAQVYLDSGLIASYPFNGNAIDSSGNGHDCTVYGATLTMGRAGIPNTAYHFNGSSDYMQTPDSPTLTPDTALTMCATVRPLGFYSGNCQGNIILMKGPNEMNPGLYNMGMSDNAYDANNCLAFDPTHETFYGQLGDNIPSSIPMAYTPYIITGKWYCVIATWDGINFKMYVDDTLRFTVATPNAIGINTAPLTIGHNIHVPFPYWFNGDMDDIRIYGRVLNIEERLAYCNLTLLNTTAATLLENAFEIFPNPTSGTIHFSSKEKIDGDISVRNLLGKIIHKERISWTAGSTNSNLLNAMPGIYFVSLVTKEGSCVKKVVIE
jgi:hypothetical protein